MLEIARTERTRISLITLEDAPFILELVNSRGWIDYIGDRKVLNLEDAEAFLTDGLMKVQAELGFGYYKISDEKEQSLGIAGFLKKEYLENHDFGFAFLPQYHGQGYAFEACDAVLQYGLNELKFTILDAVTLPNNQPSISLLEKLGFNYQQDIPEPERDNLLRLYQYQI